MQQTKGFIFDLDGVIVDTAKYHFLAWRSLANQLGFDFTENDNEKLKGITRVKSLEMILEWGNITLPEDEFNKQMALKNEEYLAHISDMNASEILPDVEKTLEYLKNKQQKIALGSASKNAAPILERVGLLESFKVIIDGNAVVKGKPDPEVFLKGAAGLHLDPENCIVFEDSISGIQAANKANMISIGIGDTTVLHEADYVFKDFTEISETFINKLIENDNATLKQSY